MRPHLQRLSVWLVAFALAGCSGKQATEIVVSIGTDLDVPAELNHVQLQVHYPPPGVSPALVTDSCRKINLSWDLGLVTSSRLPATLGLLPGKDLSQTVLVTVRGLLDKTEVVRRQAQLLFAEGRIVLLQLNLLRRCKPMNCGDDGSCGENGCEPIAKDPGGLPTYSEEQTRQLYLDGRVGETRMDGMGMKMPDR
jgi:hypothetical protein